MNMLPAARCSVAWISPESLGIPVVIAYHRNTCRAFLRLIIDGFGLGFNLFRSPGISVADPQMGVITDVSRRPTFSFCRRLSIHTDVWIILDLPGEASLSLPRLAMVR
jgi:hypothetical protein